MRTPSVALADITEKEWDRQLFASDGLAAVLGWRLRYHTLRSKGSTSGFPDRVIVRERAIFAEIKSEHGKPSATQVEWLDALANAGCETYLWTPSDLDEIARILTGRWEPAIRSGTHPDALWTLRDGHWTPGSLWLPGHGRHDTTVNEQQTLGVA